MLRWFRKKNVSEEGRSPAERMITLKKAEVYYLPITKCGSTYLKNLFHYLNNGFEHESGPYIHHQPNALIRAGEGDNDKIKRSGHAFTVLRDPVDRFISLYFDKIYGDGPRNFEDIRAMLAEEIGLNLTPDLSVDGHRRNCRKFIVWLDENLAFRTDEPVNPHWRRQASRVKRVEELELVHLTLEGLDWQLPMLIGDVVPNISDAMAAVKERNWVPRPFTRDELLDSALQSKIEQVYNRDLKLHNAATEYWQSARGNKISAKPQPIRVICAGDLPLYYVATMKVGCTYLKNVFYWLEHGETYENPEQIHGVGAVSHRDIGTSHNGIGFYVVRDPLDRVLSLYFDKVIGDSTRVFPWIAKRLSENRKFYPMANTIEEHRTNLNSFLGYLEHRFASAALDDLNPHWRPQVEVATRVQGYGFRAVLLEHLEDQLIQLAGDIPNVADAMAAVGTRNETPRPFTKKELLSPELIERIGNLYAADLALYEKTKKEWTDGAA